MRDEMRFDGRPWESRQSKLIRGNIGPEQILALQLDEIKSWNQVYEPKVDTWSLEILKASAKKLRGIEHEVDPNSGLRGRKVSQAQLFAEIAREKERLEEAEKWFETSGMPPMIELHEERDDLGRFVSRDQNGLIEKQKQGRHNSLESPELRKLARVEQKRTRDGGKLSPDQEFIDQLWRHHDNVTEESSDHESAVEPIVQVEKSVRLKEENPQYHPPEIAEVVIWKCRIGPKVHTWTLKRKALSAEAIAMRLGWQSWAKKKGFDPNRFLSSAPLTKTVKVPGEPNLLRDTGKLPTLPEEKPQEVPMPLVEILGIQSCELIEGRPAKQRVFHKMKGTWKTVAGFEIPNQEERGPNGRLKGFNLPHLRERVRETIYHRLRFDEPEKPWEKLSLIVHPGLSKLGGRPAVVPLQVQRSRMEIGRKTRLPYWNLKCYDCGVQPHMRDNVKWHEVFPTLAKCEKHKEKAKTVFYGQEGHMKCLCCGAVSKHRQLPIRVQTRISDEGKTWLVDVGVYGDGFLDLFLAPSGPLGSQKELLDWSAGVARLHRYQIQLWKTIRQLHEQKEETIESY